MRMTTRHRTSRENITPLALLRFPVQMKTKKTRALGIAARLINLVSMAALKVRYRNPVKESSAPLIKYIPTRMRKGNDRPVISPIYIVSNLTFLIAPNYFS
jgi:hypothetical protein